MKFKILKEQNGIKERFVMDAVELAEEYNCHITISDIHKKKAPVKFFDDKKGLTLKIYGYEGS